MPALVQDYQRLPLLVLPDPGRGEVVLEQLRKLARDGEVAIARLSVRLNYCARR